MVMPRFAGLPAQCIQNAVIGSGYLVNDALVYKSLQCTVHRNPVKVCSCF